MYVGTKYKVLSYPSPSCFFWCLIRQMANFGSVLLVKTEALLQVKYWTMTDSSIVYGQVGYRFRLWRWLGSSKHRSIYIKHHRFTIASLYGSETTNLEKAFSPLPFKECIHLKKYSAQSGLGFV